MAKRQKQIYGMTKRKYISKMICILLGAALLIPAIGADCSQVNAASGKSRALKAYRSYLAKNESHFNAKEYDFTTQNKEPVKKADSFLVMDMNRDGIPELLTWHGVSFKSDLVNIYTFRNGKVTVLRNSPVDINSQARGYYDVYACRKHHLHAKWNGGMMGKTMTVYQMKDTGLKKKAARLRGCKRDNKIIFRKNNRKNRDRYLK